jgi:hypothetical protein
MSWEPSMRMYPSPKASLNDFASSPSPLPRFEKSL